MAQDPQETAEKQNVADTFETVFAEHLNLDPKTVVYGSMVANSDGDDMVDIRWEGRAEMDMETFSSLIQRARQY